MAIRIHDPIDCVTCWAGVDHDEPDAEQKAIRIINLRIGHRAIMAVDDVEVALQIANEFLKRDAALEREACRAPKYAKLLLETSNNLGSNPLPLTKYFAI